ncbi:MAG: hypothetical protein H6Q54_1491 [Deltaproteobacteria bacterium]|jgi:hypothetical protein|nr:hypothetical protein [Deltaproteobacteria bacterium]
MTKKILLSACLLVCLLAASIPSLGAEMSVMQYMELEDAAANKDTGSPVVNMYLMAVLDSYGIANAMLSDRKQRQLYCQPDNLALGPMNLRQLINDRLKNNRALMSKKDWEIYSKTMNIAGESLFVLQETFPCK